MTEPLLGSTPFSIENGNRNRPLESDGVSKDSVAGVSLSRREAREAGAERLQTWADWRHVAAWGLRLRLPGRVGDATLAILGRAGGFGQSLRIQDEKRRVIVRTV